MSGLQSASVREEAASHSRGGTASGATRRPHAVEARAQAREILQRVFGYDDFRGRQAEIVAQVADGGDALVLMPTGAGKSLCYQVPSLMRDGTGVVVSPLIALMQDQVETLRELGVRAAFLNSTLQAGEAREVERQLLAGELDLLYVAPERLVTERSLDLLGRARIALFAIDEAHCVSQWGHDFRPEYLQLAVLHQRFPQVPRLALTATADALTRSEIVERLALEDAPHFVSSFDRPNIHYRIVEKRDPRRQLLDFIAANHSGDAGIVYCVSRAKVEETAQWLAANGVAALPYHAGMDAGTRAANQARFLREDGLVMVATIAFGMGIDKPDVRFVAHLDMPRSVEGYYQETGRAGRDGEPADAWMSYGLADVVQQRRFIDQSDAGQAHKQVSSAKLDAMLGLAEAIDCRRVRLLAYFGEEARPCGNCDNCLEPPEAWDATEAARKLLSCIWRVREASGFGFGGQHIISILRGEHGARIAQYGHDRLSTFGIGADLGEHEWRAVLRQLIAQAYVAVDQERHQVLVLTPTSRALLRGEARLQMRRPASPSRSRSRRQWTNASAAGGGRDALGIADRRRGAEQAALDDPLAERLFERLRTWRRAVATERNLPTYVVFHDATLRDIALERPQDLDALAAVNGIGQRKLEAYGADILALVAPDGADDTAGSGR
jgi:ATP-dependent DNA helicase RecQ